MSYSTWVVDDAGARVELRLKLIELTRQPPGHPWTETFPRELVLLAGDEACAASEASRMRPAPAGWRVFRWRIRCEASGPHVITSELMRDVAMAHTHFLRIDPQNHDGGTIVREHVLVTGHDAAWSLDTSPDDPEAESSLLTYIELGIEHISTGWDHLAFVVVLLLLASRLGEVATIVTGFTIAHSVTLGLASLGLVEPNRAAIESLIGFSIAIVAA